MAAPCKAGWRPSAVPAPSMASRCVVSEQKSEELYAVADSPAARYGNEFAHQDAKKDSVAINRDIRITKVSIRHPESLASVVAGTASGQTTNVVKAAPAAFRDRNAVVFLSCSANFSEAYWNMKASPENAILFTNTVIKMKKVYGVW